MTIASMPLYSYEWQVPNNSWIDVCRRFVHRWFGVMHAWALFQNDLAKELAGTGAKAQKPAKSKTSTRAEVTMIELLTPDGEKVDEGDDFGELAGVLAAIVHRILCSKS